MLVVVVRVCVSGRRDEGGGEEEGEGEEGEERRVWCGVCVCVVLVVIQSFVCAFVSVQERRMQVI